MVPRLENGWVSRPWGFDSLSFRSARRRVRRASPPGSRRDARYGGMAEPGKAARCYRAGALGARRFESCCLRCFKPHFPARAVAAGGRLCRPGGQARVRCVMRRRRGPVGEPWVPPHLLPRVAQWRRAPLLQRGGWGFESLAADPSLRSPTRQRRPAQTRKVRGSNPRGGTHCGVVQTAGRPVVTRAMLVRAQPPQLIVGEPMVPPRAPSFRAGRIGPALGLPAGKAGLRP